MITAAIFDLSEVLLQGLKGTEFAVAKRLGLDPETVHAQFQGPQLTALFRGRISEAEYWRGRLERHGWPTTVPQLQAAVRANFREIPGTRAVLEELRQSGVRLGLLSDHAQEWVADIEPRFSVRRHFDAVIYSFEVGLKKPEPGIYRQALRALGVDPASTVFIDDHPPNLEPAARLGLTTIRFVNADHLRQEFTRIGLLTSSDAPRLPNQ